jgi:hypothetical protein
MRVIFTFFAGNVCSDSTGLKPFPLIYLEKSQINNLPFATRCCMIRKTLQKVIKSKFYSCVYQYNYSWTHKWNRQFSLINS